MHIPDNYISPSTNLISLAIMIPVWRASYKHVVDNFSKKNISYLGFFSSFIFLAMMFNVPIIGGTTGHIMGAALATFIIGPEASIICMSVVLAIQAFLFGDGGILALSTNCLLMGAVSSYTTSFVYKFVYGMSRKKVLSRFIASYMSMLMTLLGVAFVLGIQTNLFKDASGLPMYNPYPLGVTLPALMIPGFLMLAPLEAVATTFILKYMSRDTFVAKQIDEMRFDYKKSLVFLGIMALFTPLGLLVSGGAWGEWGPEEIAQKIGYIPQGMKYDMFSFSRPFADYTLGNLSETSGYVILGLFIATTLIGFFFFVEKRMKAPVTIEGTNMKYKEDWLFTEDEDIL